MPGTDLTFAQAPLADRMNWARAISGAGDLVPAGFRDRNGAPNPAKILLAAEYGAMIGLHPMAALTGINVIEGKPSPSPALMSALVRNAGHKLRITTTGTWDKGDFIATATLIRADDPKNPFVETWDASRAKRAGLLPASSPKSSWARYPEAMCKWRAVSAVCRDGAEDVLLGAHYVPEELGAEVNEAGEVVDITATAVDRTPRTKKYEQDEDGPAVTATMKAAHTDEHAVADEWADRARKAITVTDARDLYRDANHRGILGYPLTSGELLGDVLRARGEHLADEEAHAAEADVPLEIPADDVPAELPW